MQVHESTVGRCVKDKYLQCRQGTFPLRYFFSGEVNGFSGQAVRMEIRALVRAEDGHRPLSDSRIADMLDAKGISVARRTVAKYRQEMGIPPASGNKHEITRKEEQAMSSSDALKWLNENFNFVDSVTIIDHSGTIITKQRFNPRFTDEENAADNQWALGKNLLEVFPGQNFRSSALLAALKTNGVIYRQQEIAWNHLGKKSVTNNLTIPIVCRSAPCSCPVT